MSGKREYGDYQTPEYFSERICRYLKEKRKLEPSMIIEPTCGVGSFLKSSLIFEAREIIGIEVNKEYCKACIQDISDPRVRILNYNFFDFNFKPLLKKNESLLIVGNPPWVNNSTLAALDSNNLPVKTNFKGLKGVEAITGASNFDICEYIIWRLIKIFEKTKTTLAMLCKTSVARNLFMEMKRTHMSFKKFDMFEFNANKVFGISASACLLVIELSENDETLDDCQVFDFDYPELKKSSFGFVDGEFYSDTTKRVDDYAGKCCFEWRQGVKHDCSKIMELSLKEGILVNGLKEQVDIEKTYVFPLVKSSMFKKPIVDTFSKYVIVTQKKAREDTSHIERDAPKTWKYLMSNKEYFIKRKSSIYKNAPDFSMFGVGDYSYSYFKVGVSGFYKKPLFSMLVTDGQPVMADDTSYFICFSTYDMAYTAMLILNSERVQKFLISISFLDAKRPFTKKVLERIDFHKILSTIDAQYLSITEEQLGIRKYFKKEMLDDFRCSLPKTVY